MCVYLYSMDIHLPNFNPCLPKYMTMYMARVSFKKFSGMGVGHSWIMSNYVYKGTYICMCNHLLLYTCILFMGRRLHCIRREKTVSGKEG